MPPQRSNLEIILRTFAFVVPLGFIFYYALMLFIEHVDRAQHYAAIVLIVPFTLFLLSQIRDGYRTGIVPLSYNAQASRDADPVKFWFALGWMGIAALIMTGLSLYSIFALS